MCNCKREIIGKELKSAIALLEAQGFSVKVVRNISDKQKAFDVDMVTATFFKGNEAVIVYSNFLNDPLE